MKNCWSQISTEQGIFKKFVERIATVIFLYILKMSLSWDKKTCKKTNKITYFSENARFYIVFPFVWSKLIGGMLQ